MNILYYYIDAKTVTGSWQRMHYIDELVRNGHKITIFSPYNYSSINEANEKLIGLVKKKEGMFDLFFNAYGDDLLYIDSIKTIRKYMPTLLVCFDNLQIPFFHKKIAPNFDLVWLTSFETKYLYERWGCKCIFLPYAANPYIFKPKYTVEMNTVGFVGSLYGTRIDKINDLVENNIDCTIYSNSVEEGNKEKKIDNVHKRNKYDYRTDFELLKFSIGRRILLSKIKKKYFYDTQKLANNSNCLKIYPSVSFDEMNQLYSNFSLSLGITELWDTYVLKKPIYKLHLRTFEIPMCGGIQIAPYSEELASYFENEKEIILYSSKDEFIDKSRFYMQDKFYQKRQKIKYNARSRAESEHTWMNRFNILFSKF